MRRSSPDVRSRIYAFELVGGLYFDDTVADVAELWSLSSALGAAAAGVRSGSFKLIARLERPKYDYKQTGAIPATAPGDTLENEFKDTMKMAALRNDRMAEILTQVTVPYPSLADAGFLGAVPFAIGGIRAFWSDAARGTSASWRVWFDGLIVAIALTCTAWAFGLREVYESDSSTRLLDLAYPVTDIVVGTVLILAIRRATHQQAGKMAFLLAGIACYSVADSAFAYLSAHGTYDSVGSVLNTGWFAGFLLIALAATYPAEPARATLKPARLDLWQLALPWMTLLLASAGDVYSSLTGHDIDLLMSSLTAALALLLTVNMIIERKEFLEMLNEIEESHSTLNRDFRTGLVGIEQFSKQMADSEQLDVAEARRLAGEINRNAERLDRLVEQML